MTKHVYEAAVVALEKREMQMSEDKCLGQSEAPLKKGCDTVSRANELRGEFGYLLYGFLEKHSASPEMGIALISHFLAKTSVLLGLNAIQFNQVLLQMRLNYRELEDHFAGFRYDNKNKGDVNE